MDVSDEMLKRAFERAYEGGHIVDVIPFGGHPDTQSVRGANIFRLAVHRPLGGKALQNMNVMLGLVKTAGLWQLPALP